MNDDKKSSIHWTQVKAELVAASTAKKKEDRVVTRRTLAKKYNIDITDPRLEHAINICIRNKILKSAIGMDAEGRVTGILSLVVETPPVRDARRGGPPEQ